MSGCFPSGEIKKCHCSCHYGAPKFMRTSNPPKSCCECESVTSHSSINPDDPKFHDKKKCKCVSCLSEQIDELRNMYKADYETAKDIIFAGAQTHASILKLEHRASEIEKNSLGLGKHIERLVNIDVIHTMRQTIETWQKGCQVLIDNLQSRIKELESLQEITHLQDE